MSVLSTVPAGAAQSRAGRVASGTRAYIASAEHTIRLAGLGRATDAIEAKYERVFDRLLRLNDEAADLLTAVAGQTQEVAAAEAGSARREVATASMAAFVVWFAALG